MRLERKIKNRIIAGLFRRHWLLTPLRKSKDVRSFLERFREKFVSVDLMRIGGDGDGGYLLPNDLTGVEYCLSPGVSHTANFESELSRKFGIKSFMADASVDAPPLFDENFQFIPRFLGSRTNGKFITLSDWAGQAIGSEGGEGILQMDIEGGEYDVLVFETSDFLARFRVMIIEFHMMQNIFEDGFFRMFSAVFEKIYRNFSICHVHPNNCCGTVSLDGVEVPRVMEVTFIRNDLVDRLASPDAVSLPHRLDRKNVKGNDDIVMPEIWWRKS